MGGQEQNQTVDPAIQQITEFISNSINDGEDPVSIVMGLVDQEIDEQIIAQAFMTAGYEEEDLIALFEEVQKKSQPPVAPSPEEQNKDPQEIARKQAMELEAAEANAQQDQTMVSQQDAMSQTLMGKSGIEIKPENEGKFTRWAKAHGMSVPEASNAVMSNTDNYSSSVVKMANFAKNAAGWKKEEGGDPSNYTEGVRQREGSYNPPNRKYTLDPRFRKEGGEFKPHFMFKGERKIRAKDMATHLRLKERGYDHEAPKAADGTELTEDEKFYNRTGVVKREDVSTYSPNYMNPLALASNKNFNLDDAASVLKDGYNTFLGDEGIITDRKRRKAQRKENKGNYYDYDLTIDENDPNTYGFDNLDLFNASKNNGGLRDLQTFTDDVNENSKANYNVETGEYDTLMSSRPLNKNIYGEQKGFLGIGKRDANSTYEFGQNLNYFNEYENDATKDLILGTQDDAYNDGTSLGIDEKGRASSYAPDADNPFKYDTMMGLNPVVDSMIPTGSNGQPEAGMSGVPLATQSGPTALQTNTAERPSFREWRIQNAINFQGKSEADLQTIYNSIEDDKFRYGGSLPKAQPGTEFGGGDFNAMFLNPFEVGNNNQNINVLINPATGEPWEQSQQSIEQYPDLVGIQGNGINNASGMFNVNQDFELSAADVVNIAEPSYEDPTVERRGKLRGATNRVMDRLKPFGKVSDFAVKGAGLLNDLFRDKRVNEARVKNRDNLVADEIHGTYENPFMDRGTWDINTGTFGQESDRYAQENMGIAKQGGETANVDSIILAKLIAAGADIEIL